MYMHQCRKCRCVQFMEPGWKGGIMYTEGRVVGEVASARRDKMPILRGVWI